jgi:outer membrane protein assembly factor BamA
MNFQGNTMETLLGGSVTLGFKVAEKTTLSISPQFYYVSGANGLYSYYQPSLKAALEVDGRDNWLLPKSGYYVFTSLEAGFRFGSSDEYYKVNGNKTTLENKFSQFFLNNYNEGRYYVLLPGDMVLAFRGMFGMGYNLAGGGQYIAGGPLNPYFRASKGIQSGYGLVGGSIELRAPVIDLNYVQMQFYAFGDGGFILGGGPSYGVGPGLRLAVPYLGVVNFGYGWPGGFFIWFGDLGWN